MHVQTVVEDNFCWVSTCKMSINCHCCYFKLKTWYRKRSFPQ